MFDRGTQKDTVQSVNTARAELSNACADITPDPLSPLLQLKSKITRGTVSMERVRGKTTEIYWWERRSGTVVISEVGICGGGRTPLGQPYDH